MPDGGDAGGRTGGPRRAATDGERARSLRWSFLLALAAAVACGERDAGRRVLLVGLDGASPRVVEPLLAEGRLPNLERIAREGVHGRLRSEPPLLSPVVWTTIATGTRPAQHGIHGFALASDGVQPRLSRSSDRKVPAIWNIASGAGLGVGVVNWWATFPPEQVDGVMVSEHVLGRALERQPGAEPDRPPAGFAFPERWEPRLLALDAAPMPVPFADPFRGNTALPHWARPEILSRWFEQDAQIARYALEIEAAERPALMMVLLTGIDRVSHSLWGTLEPEDLYPASLRPTPAAREAGAAALRGYYAFSDALIGRLLEGYGPDDLVMVVSDHGFAAGAGRPHRTGEHETGDALYGVLFARGLGIPAGAPAGEVSILDLAPTILAWLRLPVADDMPGRVAAFLASPEYERIPSYGTSPIPRRGDPTGGADHALFEQLRALGYVE